MELNSNQIQENPLANFKYLNDLIRTGRKEIVLEAEILAPSTVSDFRKDKTPKALDFTGFSAFSTV